MEPEDWKSYRKQIQAQRDMNQPRIEDKIAKLVASGPFDAIQLNAYQWRLSHTSRPKRTVDFWPRTGTYQFEGKVKRPGPDRGLKEIQEILNAPDDSI